MFNLDTKGIIRAMRISFFSSFSLTFVLAVARRVLTLLDEDLGRCVQGNRLSFGHQEQHDKFLAHDAQRFVFPVTTSYETQRRMRDRGELMMSLN